MRLPFSILALALPIAAAETAAAQTPARRQLVETPLSTMPALTLQGGEGPVEIDTSVGRGAAGDGNPITIGGVSFADGLGTAATSVITYDVRGMASAFTAWVGVDDEVANAGSVEFLVVADDVTVYSSGLRTGADPPLFTGHVDLRGVRELMLVVTDGGDGFHGDHADWAEPRLLGMGGTTGGGVRLRGRRGAWERALDWPLMPIGASLLPSGHLLTHASASADGAGSDDTGDPHDSTRVDLARIATWSHQAADHPSSEIYAAAHALRPDGSVQAFGGHRGADGAGRPLGVRQQSRFDAATRQWIPTANLGSARHGASALTLGSGDLLSVGGAHASGESFVPELYDGCRWRELSGVDYSTWLENGEPASDQVLPFVHLASDGRVFWAGWDRAMGFFHTRGAGAWEGTFVREQRQRAYGCSVLYDVDRVLVLGGVDHNGGFGEATASAVRVDFSGVTPVVGAARKMRFPRADADATVLADGRVLVSGGGYRHATGADPSHVRVPEIWDPAADAWQLGAEARHARGYRSTALLLPDGRVWTGGGECGAGCTNGSTAEVYQPPYLFDSDGQPAARPTIVAAPDEATYGTPFPVTLGAGDVATRVTLVRLGSVTRGVAFDQRFQELDFRQGGAQLTVTPPVDGNAAPPGPYMLFVLDAAGVPSVSAILRLDSPAPAAWQTVASTDGSDLTCRHEAAMVEVGGRLYLMGGRGSRPVEEYDTVTGRWTSLGNPPFEMHHFQPLLHDGLVWVVGAFTGPYPNESNVSHLWTWDPATSVWTQRAPMPAGRNRGSAGAVLHGGKLYLVGGNTMGHNGGAVPWLDVFDPATGSWTALADAPRARDHFLAAVVGNKLVAAGGRRTDQPNPFDKTEPLVDVYDFTAGTWTTVADALPTQRAGTMTVAIDQHVVVVGGESASQGEAHDEVEALDVLTGEWLALPELVEDRHSGGIATHRGRIWVASGSGHQGGAPELDTLERIGAGALLSDASTNLVSNAGFDGGIAGWADHGVLALSAVAGVKPPALDVRQGWAGQAFAGAAGTTYRFGALLRASGGAGTVEVGMQYLDSGGGLLGQDVVTVGAAPELLSVGTAGTAPAGTAAVRVRLYADGVRILIVDDVSVVAR